MKKKIGNLTDNEILDILGDDICKYCPYESIETKYGESIECPKEIVSYGEGPVYPSCMEDGVIEEIINNFKDNVDLDQEVEVNNDYE